MSETQTPKPSALPVSPDLIPDDLRAADRWLVWRWTWHTQRKVWTKPPRRIDGMMGSSTDPTSWTTFEEAYAAYDRAGFDGVGIAVTEGCGLVGVDFDRCLTADALDPRVVSAVRSLNSYTEWSPSGVGIRVFVGGTLPVGHVAPWVELYPAGRYLTVTGHLLHRAPRTIESRQDALDALVHQITPEPPLTGRGGSHGSQQTHLNDADILDHARRARNGTRFHALYDLGDIHLYDGDRSRADQALASMLAFWTGDADQIDRLMRSSALHRDKWDSRADYRRRTTDKALSGGERYGTYLVAEETRRVGSLDRIRAAR